MTVKQNPVFGRHRKPCGQWKQQSRCHALVAEGAKLGPLFTVCLFLSSWDLSDRAGQGQLVIRKLQMPEISLRSANAKEALCPKLCPIQNGHSQMSWDCQMLLIYFGRGFDATNIVVVFRVNRVIQPYTSRDLLHEAASIILLFSLVRLQIMTCFTKIRHKH